ncbi:hypothetical protein AIOL_001457 [Candidatus Rhodobacter oscarellae]|uniref:Uncharacterized protein n=1 Tax=Candidatus Rhodobacter oscarellae TaxID=1675527 RepID=A0A0J9GSL9_9RHOB|nr:hypothetical protein AIOL_001457 [Candidatus Rhodobacter lobularis]
MRHSDIPIVVPPIGVADMHDPEEIPMQRSCAPEAPALFKQDSVPASL